MQIREIVHGTKQLNIITYNNDTKNFQMVEKTDFFQR